MSYPYSGINAVTLGSYAGSTLQSTSAIALGYNAGASSQGASAIAIGSYAGYVNQPASSIVMNATGSTLNGANANATYIAPLRNVAASTVMCYDPINKEATYSNVVQCSTLTVSSISSITFPDGKVQNSSAIGYGQTYNNVIASRVAGTTYTNSTGRPIFVTVSAYCNAGGYISMSEYVNGSVIAAQQGVSGSWNPWVSGFFIVPNGATYQITLTSNTTYGFIYWSELS